MTDQSRDENEVPSKPTCVLKEMLSFFQEPVCQIDRQETWVGWDGWVADTGLSRDDDAHPQSL